MYKGSFLTIVFYFLYIIKSLYGIEISKIEEGLYIASSKHQVGVYYAMEKVDEKNIDHWLSYYKTQIDLVSYINTHFNSREKQTQVDNLTPEKRAYFDDNYGQYREMLRSLADPLYKFNDCLRYCKKTDLWVAYAINKPLEKKFNFETDINNIEIAVAILTDKDVPFSLHMGMARAMKYLEGHNLLHKNIACELHAFAAKVILMIDKTKQYLITTPLPIMRNILEKKLPKASFWIGQNNEDSVIHIVGKNLYDDNFQFILLDGIHEILFKTNAKDAGDKYWWFFANTQPSASTPYFTADLKVLSSLFQ